MRVRLTPVLYFNVTELWMMAARGKQPRGIDVVLREIGHELLMADQAKLVVYDPVGRQFLEAPAHWLSAGAMYEPSAWPHVQPAPRRRQFRTPVLGRFRKAHMPAIALPDAARIVSLGRPELVWRCIADHPELKHIVMIHDVTRAEGKFRQPRRATRFHQRLLNGICEAAKAVLTPSQLTADKLEALTGRKATVLSLARTFRKVREAPEPPIAQPFVLHVGAMNSWKNGRNLLGATTMDGTPRLVLAGDVKVSKSAGVTHVNTPDHTELQALYSASSGLIVPSFSEGFSLPIGEALAFGKPIAVERGIASLVPNTIEPPILFDGTNISDIARAMKALLDAPPNGLVAERDWRVVAKALVTLCRD